MKEKYVSMQAIKRGHGYGYVSSSTKSPVDSYLCVCMCVRVCVCVCVCACVCVCNGSAPGSSIRCAPQMCVCVCAQLRKIRHHHSPQLRKIKGKHGCVYVCVRHHHSTVDSCLCVYVCACILTSLNVCNYIRQLFYC